MTGALRTHRDPAMVAAMVFGGLRRCEVLGLRLEDLRVAERRVFIAEGNGGHQRLVPVSSRFFAAVATYLEVERLADAGTTTPRVPQFASDSILKSVPTSASTLSSPSYGRLETGRSTSIRTCWATTAEGCSTTA